MLKVRKNISNTIFILVLANKKHFFKILNPVQLIFYLKARQDHFKYIQIKVINFVSFYISCADFYV